MSGQVNKKYRETWQADVYFILLLWQSISHIYHLFVLRRGHVFLSIYMKMNPSESLFGVVAVFAS